MKKYVPILCVWLAIILQASIALIYAITLRNELKTSGYDGALFEQLLSNVINGHGLITTLAMPDVAQHWFGIHFSPILYALVPFYYLFPRMETLLVFQTFTIAFAAWPIFLSARTLLNSSWYATLVALFYLINPFVLNAEIWDFHEIAFAPLTIAWLMWALIHQKRAAFVLLCALLMTIKSHYGLAVFGFGLLWAWHWRELRFGACIAAFGLVSLALILGVIMPHFSLANSAAWVDSGSRLDRFSWVMRPFAKDSPLLFLGASMVMYLMTLLFSYWLLPLTAPLWLLPAIADFAANSLSTNPLMRSTASYHSASLIPIILIAFTASIDKQVRKNPRLFRRDIFIATGLFCVLVGVSQSVLPITQQGNVWEFSTPRLRLLPEDAQALKEIEKLIPPQAYVSAQNNIIPHLKPRLGMFHFSNVISGAHYIVLNTNLPPFKKNISVFGAPYSETIGSYVRAAKQVVSDPRWAPIYYTNHWLVLQKDGKDNAEFRIQALSELAAVEALGQRLK